MAKLRFLAALMAALGELGAAGGTARADAIDGDWCREGRSFTIQGSALRTPAGNNIRGDYDRHGFHYVVPAGEPDAGTEITMWLRGEETVELARGAPTAPREVWKRCKPVS
jgi:hypothetical protein